MMLTSSADPEGGGGGAGVRTPLKFVRGGGLVYMLMGRRGGPNVIFTLLLSNFYYTSTLHVYILWSSMFSIKRSSFLYISLILKKRIQLPIPFLWKDIFIFFVSRITRFYTISTKKFLGRTPTPLPGTFTGSKLPCHLCVCVERGLQLYNRSHPIPKKKNK